MTDHPNNAPLPGYAAATAWDGSSGNLGLWYDKYCDRWHAEFTNLHKPEAEDRQRHVPKYEGGRVLWLKDAVDAARSRSADADFCNLLSEFAARQQAFVGERGGIVFRAKTTKKFATGLGRAHPVQNGFEWHYTLGVPMLRGSGQKGIVRDWVRTWDPKPEGECDRILGSANKAGAVDFLPALPIAPPELCVDGTTPHLTDYYQNGKQPADWYSPVPLQWMAVAPAAVFQFALVPARPTQPPSDVETAGSRSPARFGKRRRPQSRQAIPACCPNTRSMPWTSRSIPASSARNTTRSRRTNRHSSAGIRRNHRRRELTCFIFTTGRAMMGGPWAARFARSNLPMLPRRLRIAGGGSRKD